MRSAPRTAVDEVDTSPVAICHPRAGFDGGRHGRPLIRLSLRDGLQHQPLDALDHHTVAEGALDVVVGGDVERWPRSWSTSRRRARPSRLTPRSCCCPAQEQVVAAAPRYSKCSCRSWRCRRMRKYLNYDKLLEETMCADRPMRWRPLCRQDCWTRLDALAPNLWEISAS